MSLAAEREALKRGRQQPCNVMESVFVSTKGSYKLTEHLQATRQEDITQRNLKHTDPPIAVSLIFSELQVNKIHIC